MSPPNRRETIILIVFFLLANVGNCVYAAFGMQPSGGFMLLYYAGAFWAIAAWIIADARRLSVPLPFDMGWLTFFAWPVVLPYHVFRTRGVKGFLTLAGFVGLFLSTYLVGVIVFYMILATRGA